MSSGNPKPTIALVTGAWHSPKHYHELLNLLNKAGFPTECVKLPSVNSQDPENQTLAADVDAIREKLLLPLIHQGREVVLLMHSYGGCVGGAAAKGLSRAELGSEATGAVIGLVFFAAFLVPEGNSVIQTAGGKLATWIVDKGDGQLDVDNPAQVFFIDAPVDKASWAVSELGLQSLESVSSPCPPTAWDSSAFDGRRGYIYSRRDEVIQLFAQEMMINLSGVEWNIKEMDTGHSPHLSNSQELAEHIEDIISSFEA
ncbi:Alpha/beta hydrolase fold-1 [Talaromyces proteolyticus]|uniref:Alpha/beta hydrolase fold-1 n=1 Tax=Talaromyces proteolyticus TaxID=1131652 RepID=A0AAD4L0Q7_9EURO|nr:Alpha/beta hydrolase fold-1 [Talaromyces proteolyticus]KAH8705407.1 Alpha/beta hydrolase fold-1 [Talaromyces proteolyticus]